MPNKLNLIYKLEGSKVDEIDVFELAPILLSLGTLIEESNKTLNPDGEKIAVNVKPFEKGSFIIDIVLFAQNNLQQLINLANTDQVVQIKNLLEEIGIVIGIGSAAGVSLIKLIKYLKGVPTKVEALGPNEYRYYANENTSITVNGDVHQLFQNPNIQQVVYKVYGKPLEAEGFDEIKTYLKDEEQETKVEIEKSDAEIFKAYSSAVIPSTEETLENTLTIYLNPKRGSFEGEANSWSFRKGGDKSDILTATIKDVDFLNKLRTGEIRLFQNDLLKVELLVKQKLNGTDVKAVTYEIISVLDYQKAPEQPLLGLQNGEL